MREFMLSLVEIDPPDTVLAEDTVNEQDEDFTISHMDSENTPEEEGDLVLEEIENVQSCEAQTDVIPSTQGPIKKRKTKQLAVKTTEENSQKIENLESRKESKNGISLISPHKRKSTLRSSTSRVKQ